MIEIASDPIREVTKLALQAGNRLTTISADWEPKQVVFMDQPMDAATKAEIAASFPSLEHFTSEPTPHNPATEGFMDRQNDVVISFPARGEERRWYPFPPAK